MIDFHCHLDLNPDPLSVVKECAARAMYVLSVTTTPSAWEGTSKLATEGSRIRTALGLHPQLAHQRHQELALFDKLLCDARYVGEVGLDGGSEYRPHRGVQQRVFEHILKSCKLAGGRVLSIHSRHAAAAVLDTLESHPGYGIAVLHWFSGSEQELDRAIAAGHWFSVGPAMLGSARGQALAARMPRERVLTESDAPFTQVNGRSLSPWDVEMAVDALARIWQVPPRQTGDLLLSNLGTLSRACNLPD